MQKKKIKVKMLGNYKNYEAETEIEIPEDEAIQLVLLGYAKEIDNPVVENKQEKE